MKIVDLVSTTEHFPLTRPYQIAYRAHDAVSNAIVRLILGDGTTAWGAASPSRFVTGETIETCSEALRSPELKDLLIGQDIREVNKITRLVARVFSSKKCPAAQAAIDMALHDGFAQHLALPLVDVLGRCYDKMLTSITIGIKDVSATLSEADEYYQRGFRILKVKLGHHLEEDIERLRKLRERFAQGVALRVDPNQGYSFQQLQTFLKATDHLSLEFVEQPLPVAQIEELHRLSLDEKNKIALDESLCTSADALQHCLPQPKSRVYNIKLMKCGGISEALRIATIADLCNRDLMWGCMDESIISISAALHSAFSCSRTRYIDLDGSLDLARDVVSGGFEIKDGYMSPHSLPGLGVVPLN